MATEPGSAKTLSELRSLPDDELIRQHDALIQSTPVMASVNYYLNELQRREVHRLTKTIAKLTWVLVVLTGVLTVATIVIAVSN
jgi:CHASE3 domain sensor protein